MNLVPLRYLSRVPVTNGLGLSGARDNPEWPRYIRTTDIAGPTSLRDDVFASQPPEVAAAAMVAPGDILMTAAGASIGKSVTFSESYPACYAGFLVRLRPHSETEGRFLGYWMQSTHYWDQIRSGAVKSTIENFSASRYRALLAPRPELSQQRAIVEYLEEETQKIDALVAEQEGLVEVLIERRSAVITHAVTRGGGGAVSDGIDHLVPLRYLSRVPVTNGLGLSGAHDNPEWPRYIRTTDIAGPTSLRDDVFASQPPEVAAAAMVAPGDILMTAAGASIGKSVTFSESYPACYAGFLVRLRPHSETEGRFLGYWMQLTHYWDQIRSGAVKSTIENFSASRYRALLAPQPELSQQRAIVEYLDEQTQKIDVLIAEAEGIVTEAKERRMALITAAVTDRIDVRGEVA